MRPNPIATVVLLSFLASASASAAVSLKKQPAYSAAVVNERTTAPLVRGARGPAVLRMAVLLDRANFSCGEIDGVYGQNVETALASFRRVQQLKAVSGVTAADWAKLNTDSEPIVVAYTITPEDAAGPFVKIPLRMMAKSRLATMGYQSLVEALGERFHSSPALLRTLNPKVTFAAGKEILVPNVLAVGAAGRAVKVVVRGAERTLTAYDENGAVLAAYPATIGSNRDPLPIGEWKINGVARNPVYNYNPRLFWDAEAGDRKAKIAAGPNNPVGAVWIDLTKEHYGIHGTPEPSTIGKTYSHGCIRLTNWDAQELGALVKPGTVALLEK